MANDTLDEKELASMLCSERDDIRIMAMEYTVGLTGNDEGKIFFRKNQDVMRSIWKLTEDKFPPICLTAFTALINLSSEDVLSDCLLEMDIALPMLKNVLKRDYSYADKAAMILSNMTRTELGRKKVLDICLKDPDLTLSKFVDALCMKNYNPCAEMHFIAPFLSNLTCLKEARHFILDEKHCVIQRLLPFTQYMESNVRRHGSVGILRNCLFETDSHEWVLSDAVDILPHLLLPLAGPEEFDEGDMERLPPDLQYLGEDKKREPDEAIRQMLLESLYWLCSTQNGRLYLKEKNVYVILRELHKWEKDKQTKQANENLIHILIGDEPEKGMENLHEVKIPENVNFTRKDDA